MATDKQQAASRANGAKSRGPVTQEGKDKCSLNRLRHGILARTVVLPGESTERFHELLTSLREELAPQTAIENLLIQKMVVAQWRQMRMWGIEKAGLVHEVRNQPAADAAQDPPTRDALAFRSLSGQSRTGLINLHEARYDRQFTSALEQIRKLRRRNDDSDPRSD